MKRKHFVCKICVLAAVITIPCVVFALYKPAAPKPSETLIYAASDGSCLFAGKNYRIAVISNGITKKEAVSLCSYEGNSLDAVIVLSADKSCLEAVAAVLNICPVSHILIPAKINDAQLNELADASQSSILPLKKGKYTAMGDLLLNVISSGSSLAVKITHGQDTFLFSPDAIEKPVSATVSFLPADAFNTSKVTAEYVLVADPSDLEAENAASVYSGKLLNFSYLFSSGIDEMLLAVDLIPF